MNASDELFVSVIAVIVRLVEASGVAIMVIGGSAALLGAGRRMLRPDTRSSTYEHLRRTLGRSILLGLEVLIVADIIRTIVVDSTVQSVVVLATIVIIRVLLSFSLEVEIDGYWPWTRWKAAAPTPKRQGR